MTNDKYFAVETDVFTAPTNPGAAATINCGGHDGSSDNGNEPGTH
jgi:hypothetical protein